MKRFLFSTILLMSSLVGENTYARDNKANLSLVEPERVKFEFRVVRPEDPNCPPKDEPGVVVFDPLRVICWDSKRYNPPGTTNPEDDFTALRKEQEICECLRGNINIAVSGPMKVRENTQRILSDLSVYGSEEDLVRNFMTSVGKVENQLHERINGTIFQSLVISNANEIFSKEYSARDSFQRLLARVKEGSERMKKAAIEEARRQFNESGEKIGNSWLKNRRDKKNLEGRVIESLNSMKIPEEPDTSLLTNEMVPGQCVSAAEFLAFKQAPTEKDLNTFLTSTSAYNPEDWNYEALEKKLVNLTARRIEDKRKLKDEILSVKSRMRFLRLNPMLRDLFAADPSTNEKFFQFSGMSSEERNKWANSPGWAKLNNYKQELFNIIKGVASTQKCSENRKECQVDENRGNRIADYRKKLQSLFSDKDVKTMTMIESAKSAFASVESLTQPQSFDYHEPVKTLAQVESDFAGRFTANTGAKVIQPSECYGKNATDNLSSCTYTYVRFCEGVDEAMMSMEKDVSTSEDLGIELGLDDNIFNPDINSNVEFKKFNDSICNKTRMSLPPGDYADFNQFKRSHCASRSSASECRGTDAQSQNKLRELFLTKYPSMASDDPDAVASEVRAFLAFTKTNQVAAFDASTAREVAKANRPANSISSDFEMIAESFLKDSATLGRGASQYTPVSTSIADTSRSSSNSEFASVNTPSFIDNSNMMFPSSSVIQPQSFIQKVSQQETTSEEDREKIRSIAEEEIVRSRKEVASATDAAQKEALESRMKFMEQLLAQKTENENKYQQLIDQLNKRLDNQVTAQSSVVKAEQDTETKKTKPALNNTFTVDNEAQNRAPASIQESFGTTGGTTGNAGAAAVAAASSYGAKAIATGRGSSSFNSALLEAQESKAGKVQKNTDGSIIIASDANTATLQSLGTAANAVSDYSLNVPAVDYAGFEAQNMETLKRYQDKFLKNMESNQPVRVFVKAQNKEPLEFYVVKDGDRLFFKPVRKTGATLEALKEVVKKTR